MSAEHGSAETQLTALLELAEQLRLAELSSRTELLRRYQRLQTEAALLLQRMQPVLLRLYPMLNRSTDETIKFLARTTPSVRQTVVCSYPDDRLSSMAVSSQLGASELVPEVVPAPSLEIIGADLLACMDNPRRLVHANGLSVLLNAPFLEESTPDGSQTLLYQLPAEPSPEASEAITRIAEIITQQNSNHCTVALLGDDHLQTFSPPAARYLLFEKSSTQMAADHRPVLSYTVPTQSPSQSHHTSSHDGSTMALLTTISFPEDSARSEQVTSYCTAELLGAFTHLIESGHKVRTGPSLSSTALYVPYSTIAEHMVEACNRPTFSTETTALLRYLLTALHEHELKYLFHGLHLGRITQEVIQKAINHAVTHPQDQLVITDLMQRIHWGHTTEVTSVIALTQTIAQQLDEIRTGITNSELIKPPQLSAQEDDENESHCVSNLQIDPEVLCILLSNLIRNATTAIMQNAQSENDGESQSDPSISVSLQNPPLSEQEVSTDHSSVWICVTNTGTPMNPDFINQLNAPLSQNDVTDTRSTIPGDHGLTLVKKLLRLHFLSSQDSLCVTYAEIDTEQNHTRIYVRIPTAASARPVYLSN